MANHKSAKKRIKQNEARRQRNKAATSRVRTEVKKLRTAIDTKDKETAVGLLTVTQSLFAKLAKSSAMNKATASRKISRLATQVNKLS